MNKTLEFTNEEVNLLITALGELPAKMSYQLIRKIEQQLSHPQEQFPPATE